MLIESETEFWEFSLEMYALPGVAEATLLLQDRDGKDVNMTLYCLYAGLVLGYRFDGAVIEMLRAAIQNWTGSVIAPLRAARRGLKNFGGKSDIVDFRRRLQGIELDAEKLAQRRLTEVDLSSLKREPGSLDLARENLFLYVGDLGQNLMAMLREALAQQS